LILVEIKICSGPQILSTVLWPRADETLHRRLLIEEAFHTVKRLLGLSYLWTGSINGVKLEVWATWY
jgi:hypothetical protein